MSIRVPRQGVLGDSVCGFNSSSFEKSREAQNYVLDLGTTDFIEIFPGCWLFLGLCKPKTSIKGYRFQSKEVEHGPRLAQERADRIKELKELAPQGFCRAEVPGKIGFASMGWKSLYNGLFVLSNMCKFCDSRVLWGGPLVYNPKIT